MNTKNEAPETLVDCFKVINDPRIKPRTHHQLVDILVIGVCAVITGAEGWEDMEEFGCTHHKWLSEFLELPNGIPGHDTFRRVFERINPEEFKQAFFIWIRSISKYTGTDLIAIDGKTSRGSYDKGIGKEAIHMVSAWSNENRLVLGQVKTDTKSNEITAIPELLKLLDLKGCIVTIDAMGCQKNIAKGITKKGGDWVLSLKGNQGTLLEDVSLYLKDSPSGGLADIEHQFHQTIEKDHGRIEIRKYWHTGNVEWLIERHPEWKCIKGIGVVESTRKINDKATTELWYFITSFGTDVKSFSRAVRSHWGIENSVHWVLDVVFKEDKSRIRNNDAPQNFAVLRHIALNLLRKEKTCKKGVKAKIYKACLDLDYLKKVVFNPL